MASVAAASRISHLFPPGSSVLNKASSLNSVFGVLCGLAVEHPWHVSFRLTEVQLHVTARVARAKCTD